MKTAFLMLLMLLAPGIQAHGLPDFTGLVEQNAPAVVNISTVSHGSTSQAHSFHSPENMPLPETSPFNELFRRFFEEQQGALPPEETESLGSGFIVSPDGYVLTNRHVVDGADEVIVRLSNRKSYEAKVVGSDQASDIALLKIDATDLPVVKIGSSKDLKIGEWVLAIGSPFGFEATVTAGIVSAKGRSLPSENYVPYIQTDVAINPGNSGGPLFNLQGEVVGINSQIFSRSGGFMGLSFAVPIELAMNVVNQLRKDGHVTRGYLGVLIQDIDRNLAESFGMDYPRGALVAKVIEDSPAARGGLQAGDVILEFNGRLLRDSSQLPPMVGTTPVGSDVMLKVLRHGREMPLTVRLAELPPQDEADDSGQEEAAGEEKAQKSNRLGLVFSELKKEERQELGIPDDQGVLVSQVTAEAAAASIQPGDVILMMDGQKITSIAQLQKLIEAAPAGKSVAFLVQKASGPVFLALHMPGD
ncbi:DegQ family serine endoprotease [Thiolapillus brandeum]|nr:DegQ family serine endoprotease [Thiolapillus brandeum]